MNFLIQKFNTLFFLFISFIFFTSLFWLYQKHSVGNDSTISEWLINYQGGFTRRGIIGEISFQIADFFGLSLRLVIFLFQSTLYLIYSTLLYLFIKDTPKNILTVVAIFSPIFILYPVAEIEVLARKEVFLYVGFILFLYLSGYKYSKNISLIYIFFIFPILCLIWEPFVFFFSFAIFIVFIRHRKDSIKKLMLKVILSFSTSIITIYLLLSNLLTPDEHLKMEASLMSNFGEICYMSCALLNNKASIESQFASVHMLLSFEVISRYLIIVLIGFSALFILIHNTKFNENLFFLGLQKYKRINSKIVSLSFVILLLPSLILFAAMTDWGRIVNIIYTFSILTYIYLLKNNLIILNKKVLILDDFYLYKKKIFFFLFVVFIFGWNQKTSMTADVATNSLYKVIYNTTKKIFHFDGIRIFQNNPIIKFHKKYIE